MIIWCRKEFPLKRTEKDASPRNTKENLENAKQIIQSKGWNQNLQYSQSTIMNLGQAGWLMN